MDIQRKGATSGRNQRPTSSYMVDIIVFWRTANRLIAVRMLYHFGLK
jgi:hypothetical protein